jgi:hypothetical protein
MGLIMKPELGFPIAINSICFGFYKPGNLADKSTFLERKSVEDN